MEKRKAIVSLKGVSKAYSRNAKAVKKIDLDVYEGDFLVLVGPSGCGKSTTLRMVAGLEDVTEGELYIDGKFANYISPRERNLAMVFQNYALYPQLNVYDNIGFSLRIKGAKKEEIKEKVFEAARLLSLGPYLDRYPRELSGGQMQRVALGRAIVKECPIYLMDEPLSNLDAKLRVQMRSEIVRLMHELKGTAIYVTHDQTEAMTMASRIVVMNEGYVQQEGTPDEVYGRPLNLFVATFIGNPPMNVVKGEAGPEGISLGGMEVPDGGSGLKSVRAFYEARLLEAKDLLAALLSPSLPSARLLVKKGKSRKWLEGEEGKAALSALREALSSGENGVLSPLRRLLEEPFDEKGAGEAVSAIEERLLSYQEAALSARSYLHHEQEEAKPRKRKRLRLPKKEAGDPFLSLRSFLEEAVSFYEEALQEDKAPAYVGFRPEDVRLVSSGGYEARLDLVEPLGSSSYLHFPLGESDALALLVGKKRYQEGDDVRLAIASDDLYLFDPVSGQAIYRKENNR